MERPFTTKTLAEYWDCSEKHVRNLIQRGELEAFRLGKSLIRIKPSAVEAYECARNTGLNYSEANGTSPGPAPTDQSADQLVRKMRLMRAGS